MTERERTHYCLSCRWWDDAISHPTDSAIPASTRKRHACRRYPAIVWRFATEWCGEHAFIHADDFVKTSDLKIRTWPNVSPTRKSSP